MHQALVGLQDEALMDMEAKYIKNTQHFCTIRPTWMSLEPPPDLQIWARSSRSSIATAKPSAPS